MINFQRKDNMKRLIIGGMVVITVAIMTCTIKENKQFEYYTFEGIYGTSDNCQVDNYGARCLIDGRMAIVSQYSILD